MCCEILSILFSFICCLMNNRRWSVQFLSLCVIIFNGCILSSTGTVPNALTTADDLMLVESVKKTTPGFLGIFLFVVSQCVLVPMLLLCAYRQCCRKARASERDDIRMGRGLPTTELRQRTGTTFQGARGVNSTRVELMTERPPVSAATTPLALSTVLFVNDSDFHTVNIDKDQVLCPICLDAFQSSTQSVFLPCMHVLHFHCLQKWIAKTPLPTCPVCRHDLRAHKWLNHRRRHRHRRRIVSSFNFANDPLCSNLVCTDKNFV